MSTGSELPHTVGDGLDLLFKVCQVVVSPPLGKFNSPTSENLENCLYVQRDDVRRDSVNVIP
jgi:hypothetical protein